MTIIQKFNNRIKKIFIIVNITDLKGTISDFKNLKTITSVYLQLLL